jgi:hypothetical protein
VAHVASVRSAKNVGRFIHVLVWIGAADSLHPSQHGPLQLAGWTTWGEGGRGTNVADASIALGARERANAMFAISPVPNSVKPNQPPSRRNSHGDAEF